MIHTEVKSRMDSTETNVTAEALPMSVWLTRGYTKEAVESFPAEVCPKLGQLYAVPARADIWKEVRTKVEEEMLLCEKAITQVKALITVKAQAQKLSLPVESIEAALQDTEEKKTAANNVVMAGNHVAAHVPLPGLPFKAAELKDHVKAIKSLLLRRGRPSRRRKTVWPRRRKRKSRSSDWGLLILLCRFRAI